MAKTRVDIPQKAKTAVLEEYRHRCAVCGHERPQLHHIDENPANNDLLNLIPLCPNDHLLDAHDPTGKPHPRKMSLFRRYKDPVILNPRFHPIFKRALFIYDLVSLPSHRRVFNGNELLSFIEHLEMGAYYRKKIFGYLDKPTGWYRVKLQDEADAQKGAEDPKLAKEKRNLDPLFHAEALEVDDLPNDLREAVLKHAAECVEQLLVEQLRYQGWESFDKARLNSTS